MENILDDQPTTLGQQISSAEKIRFDVAKKVFLKLARKAGNVEWYLCAYGVGMYHLFSCNLGLTYCTDCQGHICFHESEFCASCNDIICNRCAWTARIIVKDKGMAGKLGEISCCQFCKDQILKAANKDKYSSSNKYLVKPDSNQEEPDFDHQEQADNWDFNQQEQADNWDFNQDLDDLDFNQDLDDLDFDQDWEDDDDFFWNGQAEEYFSDLDEGD